MRRRSDADPHLLTADAEDRHGDVVADDQGFANSAGEDEHREIPFGARGRVGRPSILREMWPSVDSEKCCVRDDIRDIISAHPREHGDAMPRQKRTTSVIELSDLVDDDLMLEAARFHALARLEGTPAEGLTATPADHESSITEDQPEGDHA